MRHFKTQQHSRWDSDTNRSVKCSSKISVAVDADLGRRETSDTSSRLLGHSENVTSDQILIQTAYLTGRRYTVGVNILVDTPCPDCGGNVRLYGFKGLEGTKNDRRQCDVSCETARGHKCSCSCGGENHGKGWIT